MSTVIRQSWALVLDGYRELNAKKLFWITLMLTGLVVAAFGATKVTPTGIGVLWFEIPVPVMPQGLSNELWYKFIFLTFGVQIWLTWIAAVLGLVTTAGVIPDFVSGGSVELALSKPIGRVRLFLSKYLVGLLFVTLQVAVFSVGCFLVFGLRAGTWEPRLLLAVPIVVCFFSYLYCVCALIGLLTRSTITALLLTLLAWFVFFVVHTTEVSLLMIKEGAQAQATAARERIARMESGTRGMLMEQRTAAAEAGDAIAEPSAEEIAAANPLIARQIERAEDAERTAAALAPWHRGFVLGKTVLPKTAETTELLGRVLLSKDDLGTIARLFGGGTVRVETDDPDEDGNQRAMQQQTNQAVQERIRSRPLWWVLGTSLVFEFVVLGLACVFFARRDF